MNKVYSILAGLMMAANLFALPPVPSPLDNGPLLSPPARIFLPPSRGPGDKFGGLGLTTDQQKQIQQLQESDELNLLSARDGVRIARTVLESALRESPQDESGIQAKSDELAKSVARLIEQQSIHESKFMQILTIEQREKFSEIQPNEQLLEGFHRPIPRHPSRFETESMNEPGLRPDYDPGRNLDFDENFDFAA